MNIAVLSAANSIHTVKIVNSLSEMGHTVTLFSLLSHFGKEDSISEKVEVVYLPKNGYAANTGELKRLLEEGEYDVLYAHYATGYGTLAKRTKFHPTVIAVWGSDVYVFPNKSVMHKYLVKKNLAFADKIFSTSNAMKKVTEKLCPGDIAVTPFGVDVDEFKPARRKFGKDGVHIGFIKTLSDNYGLSYLLEAFALLTEKYPEKELYLDVYGKGDRAAELKLYAKTLKIDDKVVFYGAIPHSEVPNVLKKMDIFCVPSISESFGVAAVEAMSCGLPCLVSDADGLKEVVTDGETGIIVKKQDSKALFNALEKMVFDEKLCKSMGKAGREKVLQEYNWEDNIKIIADELQKVVCGQE